MYSIASRFFAVLLLLSLLIFVSLPAHTLAQTAAIDLQTKAQILQNLQKNMPGFPSIDNIAATPIVGLYEITLQSKQLLYTTTDGKYIFQGNLIDTVTQTNLTQERMQALLRLPFAQLPLQDAIKIVRGNGERKIAMFADPNCGFCKRFELALQDIDNLTIYLMLYPILGEDSVAKSRAVWCAEDSAKVWQDWMLNGIPIPPASCDDTSVLQRNLALGQQHGITGTPTTFLQDGRRIAGAVSQEDMQQLLATVNPS